MNNGSVYEFNSLHSLFLPLITTPIPIWHCYLSSTWLYTIYHLQELVFSKVSRRASVRHESEILFTLVLYSQAWLWDDYWILDDGFHARMMVIWYRPGSRTQRDDAQNCIAWPRVDSNHSIIIIAHTINHSWLVSLHLPFRITPFHWQCT